MHTRSNSTVFFCLYLLNESIFGKMILTKTITWFSLGYTKAVHDQGYLVIIYRLYMVLLYIGYCFTRMTKSVAHQGCHLWLSRLYIHTGSMTVGRWMVYSSVQYTQSKPQCAPCIGLILKVTGFSPYKQ